ncbi:hypothetical protein ACM16X_07100 [Haloarcula japonica]
MGTVVVKRSIVSFSLELDRHGTADSEKRTKRNHGVIPGLYAV